MSEYEDFFNQLIDFDWSDGRGQVIWFPDSPLDKIDRVTKRSLDDCTMREIVGYERVVDGPDIFYLLRTAKWGKIGYIKLSPVANDFVTFVIGDYRLDNDAWWKNPTKLDDFQTSAIAIRSEVLRRFFMFMKGSLVNSAA